MLSNKQAILKTGDWIKGKARDGELIIGYIESLSPEIPEEVVKVTVVTSDNYDMIGKTIPLLSKRVNKLPISKAINKEQIRFLIDLALSTGDEEWFLELSSKLTSIEQLVNGVY
ncbi:IDEAL domain-containing protein [Neobacillus cucumis]|uniref:IDEAL domain-containing protein n=1 Tax=Neobacillus cucumis TaxID=1740721 RepID=UPI0018DEF221|nr:IDEAL domain-containing protein [Neobacillus cucumis]MBI0579570.1 IDEAL domain-containing protein [Neobacillus cucumis]